MGKKLLYHGSPQIIQNPVFGAGNPHNDYGLGFYCTESLELAKEWACSSQTSGYANEYSLEMDGLSVLSLSSGQAHILNWLSILVNHRVFRLSNDLAMQAYEYLTKEFLLDVNAYDIVCGYRADDSYFAFASSFLNNTISLEKLSKAMMLGKLGEQIVLKSKEAFERLNFSGYIHAEQTIYYPKKITRDEQARSAFRIERSQQRASEEVYMIDILREGWKNDDSRLCRDLFE